MRTRFRYRKLAVVLLVPVSLGLACHVWDYLHYRAAQNALARRDYAEARQQLVQCLKVWPFSRATHLEAARTARKAGAYDQAERHLVDALKRGGEPEAINLEHLLLRAQRDDLASVERELVARLEQNHPDAVLILEVLTPAYFKAYQFINAKECVRQWLEREPDRLEAWLWRGQVFQRLRNRDDALASYRRVVELDPGNDEARVRLAGFLSQGHPEDALAHFEYVRQRQGDTPAVLKGMARCLQFMNQPDEARRLLEALLAEHPQDSVGLAERGRLALQFESAADAEKWFRQAAALLPFDNEVNYGLAQCLELLGKHQEAQEVMAKLKRIEADLARMAELSLAISHSPHDPALRCEAGVIMLRNGEKVEALRWLQSALQEDAGHTATHQALADYYAGAGDLAQAGMHRELARRPSAQSTMAPGWGGR